MIINDVTKETKEHHLQKSAKKMLSGLVVLQSMLPSQPQSSLQENGKCFILSKCPDFNYHTFYMLKKRPESHKLASAQNWQSIRKENTGTMVM